MAGLPEGFVDPHDLPVVTSIIDAVLAAEGATGVLELLERVPSVRAQPGVPKGFLRAAVPRSAWLGPENQLVLTGSPGRGETLVHQHVVGGIVLSRDVLAPARTAALVARLLSETVSASGGAEDASAALTAHRDLFGQP